MIGVSGVRVQLVLAMCAGALCGCGGATEAPRTAFLENSERLTTNSRSPFQRTSPSVRLYPDAARSAWR